MTSETNFLELDAITLEQSSQYLGTALDLYKEEDPHKRVNKYGGHILKRLYYNPLEHAAKIRIKSHCFAIAMEYEPCDSYDKPAFLDELFKLASLDYFEDVQVYLTSHNRAYWKSKKEASIGIRITGWVSLKEYKNGGGYLKDRYTLETR